MTGYGPDQDCQAEMVKGKEQGRDFLACLSSHSPILARVSPLPKLKGPRMQGAHCVTSFYCMSLKGKPAVVISGNIDLP